jgi:hypothetical protein
MKTIEQRKLQYDKPTQSLNISTGGTPLKRLDVFYHIKAKNLILSQRNCSSTDIIILKILRNYSPDKRANT